MDRLQEWRFGAPWADASPTLATLDVDGIQIQGLQRARIDALGRIHMILKPGRLRVVVAGETVL